MEAQFNCEECGGTENYLESGFYYCAECHTQAYGVREAVFESQEATGGLTGTRLSGKRTERRKKKEKLSTFETYNYIILGLVNELIAAGAKKELKPTVKCLWFKYLERLEVIRDGLPKLSAVYAKVDAELFYGRNSKKPKKKKKTSASSDSSDTETTATSRHSRNKRKRDFINAEYEQDASFLSQDTNSLANQSLSSLKSPSENKTDNATKLIFNKQAKNEFLKKQSQTTLHRRSVNNEILHKLTYRNLTATYKNSPNLLTRNKLFCLIYLGLLLIKDRMQLGDLLRLIREGHVSFNAVMHFFPDDLRQQKGVDLSHYLARKMPISHFATRQYTVELAKFIDVTSEIPAQNLVDLCERYCLELNLPRGIFHCALKLMAEAVPSMRVDKKSSVIPNFEGRAMCFLIFTMKLLFGLDDVTEHKFSEFATIINHINKDSKLHIKTMFVFDDWMKHIQCRRFVLKRYHFPTNFADAQNLNNVDLFVEFFQKNLPDLQTDDNEETQRVDYQVFKKLLMELQDENCDDLNLRFRSSLTPFRDYTETILRTHLQFLPNLKHSFTENCMDFLLHPYSYLKLINGNQLLEIKHRGANKVTEFIKIINPRGAQYLQRKNRRDFVAVKLQNKNKNLIKQTNSINMQSIDSGRIIKAHIEQYRGKQKKTISKLKKLSIDELFANKKITHRVEDVYEMHYNPFEMFWISSRHMDRFVAGEERFEDYLQTLPHSFVFLLEECARILEMDQRHLLEEYVTVELYLCHVVKFRRTSVLQPVMDDEVKKLINKAKREW